MTIEELWRQVLGVPSAVMGGSCTEPTFSLQDLADAGLADSTKSFRLRCGKNMRSRLAQRALNVAVQTMTSGHARKVEFRHVAIFGKRMLSVRYIHRNSAGMLAPHSVAACVAGLILVICSVCERCIPSLSTRDCTAFRNLVLGSCSGKVLRGRFFQRP
jgi:hypothetical protein